MVKIDLLFNGISANTPKSVKTLHDAYILAIISDRLLIAAGIYYYLIYKYKYWEFTVCCNIQCRH